MFQLLCGIVLIAALIITPTAVRAETAQITDTELRAAYCLGVSTGQIEIVSIELKKAQAVLKAEAPNSKTALTIWADKEGLKILVDRQDRLRDYLKVKGFMGDRNVKIIEVSLLRGDKDAKQCSVDSNDPVDKQCRRQCGPMNNVDDYKRCDKRCGDSDVCIRLKSCLDNFLPF